MLLWIIAHPPRGEGEKGALTYISRQEKQGSAGLAEQRRSLWRAGLCFYSSDVERMHPGCALAADCGDRACVHVWRASLWLRLQEFKWERPNELWCLLTCEWLGTVLPVLLNLQSRERSLAAWEKTRSLIIRNMSFLLWDFSFHWFWALFLGFM